MKISPETIENVKRADSSYRVQSEGRWLEFIMQYVVLLFLFLTASTALHAQRYTYVEYNLKDGLPQSQLRCLMQDSRGFIWVGTLGGVARFDGRGFLNYDRNNGLVNNQVNAFLETTSRQVIAAGNGGFSFINGTGPLSVTLPAPFNSATINCLHEQDNHLWIGTESGLLIYDLLQKNFVDASAIPAELNQANIKAFLLLQEHELLIMTKEKIFRWTPNNLEVYFEPTLPETGLFDLVQKDDQLWIATRGEGVLVLNKRDRSFERPLWNDRLPTDVITSICVSRNGAVWLTSRFGFFSINGSEVKLFTESNGLHTADIRDLIEDREGNIWIATYGSGLQKFTGEAFISYDHNDGLSSDAVMSVVKDVSGNHWFSTFDKGICVLNEDSVRQFNLKEITDNNRIWSSAMDEEGRLWFGSSDGLFLFEKGKFRLFTAEDSIVGDMVQSLFLDSRNNLWIGTQKGLSIHNKSGFHPVHMDGAPSKKIRCVREDKSGHIWIASVEGVFRFDGSSFRYYGQDAGLPENSTHCISVDDQNRIWVGTQNGIAVLEADKFVSRIISPTPGSNVINFIQYYQEQIWIGTNNGLYSADLNGFGGIEKLSFRHYGLDDGLRSLETNQNAVFVDEAGLWFGTTEGVTRLNTEALNNHQNLLPPLVNITGIQINLQDQNWKAMFDAVNEITGLPVNPEFRYKQNHLTFYFTAVSTTYPSAVSYQYMLEGLDDDWKSPTTGGFATYSNLPYRSFVFHVRAMNAEGKWSDIASYSFSIRPPFWLRWWFILLEVVCLLSIVYVIVAGRRKALLEKREKEWFQMRSRMLALEQQSLNSSMNRHFIFNALNSIQYYINRQDRLAANKYLSDFARLIRKNLDSSQDNLTSLRDEIERLELYLKLEHMRFKDKFEYSITVDPGLNQDAIKVPAMLVQPFLENSIWHGLLPKDRPGSVRVEIFQSGQSLHFVITDDGIGIYNSLKNKTTADNHISKGMEITQNRIELIKKTAGEVVELRGPYQISENEEGETGTKVEIILPVNFSEHFHE